MAISIRPRLMFGLVTGAVVLAMGGESFAACDNKNAESKISWTREVEPMFHTCHFCHEGAAPEQLVITPGVAYKFLVNKPSTESRMMRIEPGNPDRSYLVHKLRGTHIENGGQGERMPIGFDPMKDQEIQLLVDWIKDCSPDN